MQESYVATNGINLHIVSDGPERGPLVVLLHGFPDHWYCWQQQIPALARAGFRVVAPDQRGYNLSDKPPRVEDYALDTLTADVIGLIGALGREVAIVVGHDWGGAVAFRLAMDYPQMVRRLVVMNCPHPRAFAREIRTVRQLLRSWYIFFFQIPWLPETLYNLAAPFWAPAFRRRLLVNKSAFSDEDIRILMRANAQPGAMRAMINWYRAGYRHPPKNRTRPITAPTLIIWGENDAALGKPLTYGMDKWFGPDFRLVYIPHCGHWVQNEAAEQVNQLLLEFLGSSSDSTSSLC